MEFKIFDNRQECKGFLAVYFVNEVPSGAVSRLAKLKNRSKGIFTTPEGTASSAVTLKTIGEISYQMHQNEIGAIICGE